MVNKRSALFRRDISWPARTQPAQPPPDPFDLGELPDPATVPPPPAPFAAAASRPTGRWARWLDREHHLGAGAVHAAIAARRATISLAELRSEVVRDWLMNRWTPDSATTTRSRPPFLSPSTLAPQPTSHHTAVAALTVTPLDDTGPHTTGPRGASQPMPPTIGQPTTAPEHTQFRHPWRDHAAAGAPHRHLYDSATGQPLSTAAHPARSSHTPRGSPSSH
jgi:hypothetical protein